MAHHADDLPSRTGTAYPDPFRAGFDRRHKTALGDPFGLTRVGVNRTRLEPGGRSALLHAHSTSEELVYVLEGHPTLVTEHGEQRLEPGMCVGFPPGTGQAHQLVNHGPGVALVLEIGTRDAADRATYPQDDLQAAWDGEAWAFAHKDGRPYPKR